MSVFSIHPSPAISYLDRSPELSELCETVSLLSADDVLAMIDSDTLRVFASRSSFIGWLNEHSEVAERMYTAQRRESADARFGCFTLFVVVAILYTLILLYAGFL